MRKVIKSEVVGNVYELEQAIGSLMLFSPDIWKWDVHVVNHESEVVRLNLEEEILTDGSKVYQIRIV
jgi:hypothetical protein